MTLFVERRELLERFRLGERRALEETYRHYAPTVASLLSRGFAFSSAGRALRFGGYKEPFDLDNALAETFLRAFREPARLGYDGINPYKNYVLTIAKNLVIDEQRSRGGLVLMGGDTALQERLESDAARADFGASSAEEVLLAKELGELCTTFVGRLSERDQLFFHSRFDEAQTQVDAGKVAGLSHMQARTLEKKLRERLLSFLHAGGYLEGHHKRTEIAR